MGMPASSTDRRPWACKKLTVERPSDPAMPAAASSDAAARSLAISQHLLNTQEVMIVHHSGCGMLTFTATNDIRAKLREQARRSTCRPRRLPPPSPTCRAGPVRDDLKIHARLDRSSGTTSPSLRFVYEVELRPACARSLQQLSVPDGRSTKRPSAGRPNIPVLLRGSRPWPVPLTSAYGGAVRPRSYRHAAAAAVRPGRSRRGLQVNRASSTSRASPIEPPCAARPGARRPAYGDWPAAHRPPAAPRPSATAASTGLYVASCRRRAVQHVPRRSHRRRGDADRQRQDPPLHPCPRARRAPCATRPPGAIYLFPTKALAQDQLDELHGFITELEADIRTHTYDGDTPPESRRAVRSAGHIVLTNPDMLHTAILPHHTKWVKLFEGLEYVVIDEMHTYRGVFGSHLANVLRRLRRICQFYGADPTFIFCSATIGNPGELAATLVGDDGHHGQ
ncbi:MAG: DEAD/DEAH box helicase [Dehalococcoidia bacterium]|nr:DEAD/DEAH box helicase [Dehalococcoidia bacterium]